MKQSEIYKLNVKDLIKGFIVAVLSIVVTGLITSLNSGLMPSIQELKVLLVTGLGSGLAYLLKNFLTDSEDKFLGSEKKDKMPIVVIAFILFSSNCYADSIPFDSAKLANNIINTANGVINAVPDVNSGVSVIKATLIGLGGMITGWCIHYFKKKK